MTPMTAKTFASAADLTDKTVSFSAVGPDLYAYTAEGDPNTGIIIGDDSCMVIDAQATPLMARDVIARVRAVTDKPIKYVLLSHYHAVRVLGASAYGASDIIAHAATRNLIVERGAEDMASEIGRFPRLFRGQDSIPGLTWPTLTFEGSLTLWLGKRRVEISHPGRGHTAGDTVAWVPDAGVLFSGDLVEYRSACYCGDAFLKEWPATIAALAKLAPEALVPGRGDALVGPEKVRAAMAGTTDFLSALYGTAERSVARGLSLKETFTEVRRAMDGPFGSYAIYEHCLPFNVSRAYDEASGIAWPRIWTDARDRAMWAALQG
jgi:glyoxylase-like metal-dependent hydrolase (beta-lactamase superfamily II)